MNSFQFSLGMMLAAVAVVGIGAGLWIAEPSWYVGAVEFSLSAWGLASAIILIPRSAGKSKAFWLGFSIQFTLPTAINMVSVNIYVLKMANWHFASFCTGMSIGFRIVLVLWAFAPVVGLLCVFTHWLFVRPPQ